MIKPWENIFEGPFVIREGRKKRHHITFITFTECLQWAEPFSRPWVLTMVVIHLVHFHKASLDVEIENITLLLLFSH